MKLNKGLFISFEGPEASGKSSQILLLSKYLKKNDIVNVELDIFGKYIYKYST